MLTDIALFVVYNIKVFVGIILFVLLVAVVVTDRIRIRRTRMEMSASERSAGKAGRLKGRSLKTRTPKKPSLKKLLLEKLSLKKPPLKELFLKKLPLKKLSLKRLFPEKLSLKKLPFKKLSLKKPPLKELFFKKLPLKKPSLRKLPLEGLSLKRFSLKKPFLPELSAAVLFGKSDIKTMLKEKPESLERGLRCVTTDISIEGLPSIDFLALDRYGKAVVIEIGTKGSEEIINKGLAHLKWVEENCYPASSRELKDLPRMIILLPEFPDDFTGKIKRCKDYSIKLCRYGFREDNGKKNLTFREMPRGIAAGAGPGTGFEENEKTRADASKDVLQRPSLIEKIRHEVLEEKSGRAGKTDADTAAPIHLRESKGVPLVLEMNPVVEKGRIEKIKLTKKEIFSLEDEIN